MSDSDVDEGDMFLPGFDDQDVECLLSGGVPDDQDLAKLAPILRSLHARGWSPPSRATVARFAAQAAEIARSTGQHRTRPSTAPGPLTRPRRPGLVRQGRFAVLVGVMLVSGMTGVAVASNGAAPGDDLYGIDRALEAVGLGDGGGSERIAESRALLAADQVSAAIAHAAVAVEESGTEGEPDVANTLRAAAQEVAGTDIGDADEIRARVGEMLTWMAANAESDNGLTGREFGQTVAEFARGISDEGDAEEHADDAVDAGPPADVPAGAPEDAPAAGPPDVAPAVGPPADVPAGPPVDIPVGPPAEVPAGPPADVPAGPPDDVPAGPPDDVPAGPPADVPAGPPGVSE